MLKLDTFEAMRKTPTFAPIELGGPKKGPGINPITRQKSVDGVLPYIPKGEFIRRKVLIEKCDVCRDVARRVIDLLIELEVISKKTIESGPEQGVFYTRLKDCVNL